MFGHSTDNDKPLVSNVFGVLGAVCWSVQLAPQIYLNWRRHSAAGLSPGFMLFWASAGIPLGVYNICSRLNYALWVQPAILTTLSLATWSQCYHYEHKWSLPKVAAISIVVGAVMGGVEAALIFAIRIGLRNGVYWPLTLMAVLAALLLALGVMEQYLAIRKNKSVAGISFLFCAIDAPGDLTSIISVCFEPRLNVVAFVAYGVEFVLWCGIFACGFYFRLLPAIRRYSSAHRTQSISLHATPSFDSSSSISVFRTASHEQGPRRRQHNDQSGP